MNLRIEERVHQTMRQLSPVDLKKAQTALTLLSSSTPADLLRIHKLQKLRTSSPRPLFSFRLSERLRMLLRAEDHDTFIVEDLVTKNTARGFASTRHA